MQWLLEEVFAVQYKNVYRYLYSLSHDASLSEDLAQEVFVEAVKGITAFRGDADIKTWLFAIARNKWFSYLRKKRHQGEPVLLTEFIESTALSPEEHCQTKELTDRIYQLLEQEPERTQKIVQMRLEGVPFFEIGAAVGISESSARVIDFRVKTKIRQKLKKEGFICE